MENGTNEGSDPSSFLTEIIGSNVKVKLNSGLEYTGKEYSQRFEILSDFPSPRPFVFYRWLYESRTGKDERICLWVPA